MPNPYLRPSERERDGPNTTPGVCVRLADGRRFFFAGPTPELGLAYAKAGLLETLTDDARIEFGYAETKGNTSRWVGQKVLRPGREGMTCGDGADA